MTNANSTIVYLHLPKTGGSSIRLGIESCLDAHGGEVIHGHTLPPSQRSFHNKKGKDFERVKFAWAHWPFSYYRKYSGAENDFVYMTCLRDPIQRVISFYQEFKYREKPFANPDHRAHFIYKYFNKYSLKDALNFDLLASLPNPQGQQIFRLFDNTQTRVIANTDGVFTGDPRMILGINVPKPMKDCFLYPSATNIATDYLLKYFSWIGISEHINQEFNTMSKRFGLSCRRLKTDVQYHNVSPVKETDIDKETIQKIKDWNSYDMSLFQWCIKHREHINTRPVRYVPKEF